MIFEYDKRNYWLIIVVISITFLWTNVFSTPLSLTKSNFGRFNDTQCAGTNKKSLCIVVGFAEQDWGLYLPLIVQSKDKGKSYQAVANITNYEPKAGTLLSANCLYATRNTTCFAAGYFGKRKEESQPLVIRTQDTGNTWSKLNINEVTKGFIKNLYCIGKSKALCVGVGWDPHGGPESILIQSHDTGDNWQVVKNGLPNKGILTDVNCTGNATQEICVAIGFDNVTNQPIVLQTQDGGNHWQKGALPDGLHDATFNSVSCAGSGNAAICAVGGKSVNNEKTSPLIVQTRNSGAHWTSELIEDFPVGDNGVIVSMQCRMNNDHTICMALGNHSQSTDQPLVLIAKSVDGDTWHFKETNNQTVATFNGLGCDQNAMTCIATGNMAPIGKPVILETLDAGEHWQKPMINYNPLKGVLRGPSCNVLGENTLCLAAGYHVSLDRALPLLVDNSDHNHGWYVKEFCDFK